MYELLDISLGNLKIVEYVNRATEEVEKVYIQNGILGFFVSEDEMQDLLTLLNYYTNIERMHSIS